MCTFLPAQIHEVCFFRNFLHFLCFFHRMNAFLCTHEEVLWTRGQICRCNGERLLLSMKDRRSCNGQCSTLLTSLHRHMHARAHSHSHGWPEGTGQWHAQPTKLWEPMLVQFASPSTRCSQNRKSRCSIGVAPFIWFRTIFLH